MDTGIKRRALTTSEADALDARRPATWDTLHVHGGPDGFEACDGPVHVDGELALNQDALVVLGDLQCDVLFVNDIASLIVTGNLRARAVIANGGVYLFGGLDCDTLVGLSYGDCLFCGAGHARIGVLIEDDHSVAFNGSVDADVVARLRKRVDLPVDARVVQRDFRAGMTPAQQREIFTDAVLVDGELDVDSVCAGLWTRASPLRARVAQDRANPDHPGAHRFGENR